MTVTNNTNSNNKAVQKEIESGILKAIADMTEEDEWPEGADAFDVQMIITQLARSAAHLRESSRDDNEQRVFIRKQ